MNQKIDYKETTNDLLTRIDIHNKYGGRDIDQWMLEVLDLQPGMKLPGVVTNVTAFGAFVDIGVHQDGLVHISQISNKFLKHPSEAVAVGDIVKVVVLEADEKKKRISLSMKQVPKG